MSRKLQTKESNNGRTDMSTEACLRGMLRFCSDRGNIEYTLQDELAVIECLILVWFSGCVISRYANLQFPIGSRP